MLNCTDLACVLHHHHFYAHLHHLKHHLQDDNDHTGIGESGSNIDNNDIQGLLNDTDSELSDLSHVDAPNDYMYIIGAVFGAMVLVGCIIIFVAVTISKIRKRDDSAVSSVEAPAHHHHHNQHHLQQQQHHYNGHQHQVTKDLVVNHNNNSCSINHNHQNAANNNNCSNINNNIIINNNNNSANKENSNATSNNWVFPPLPPQPNIYYPNNQLALMKANDNHGLKGFKRQLSGRFKRLITRKPNEPAPIVIPPELKPQLKTIYVY